MWYTKGLWPIVCLLFVSSLVDAQSTIFHNDGNVVHVTPGSIVYVEGGIENHNDGLINNGGTIHFSEDWSSNTAVSDDVDALDGTFIFEGDFQDIYGSGTVAFPSVKLSPANIRTRQIHADVSISQIFDITEAEWATGQNVVSILNTDPDAILRGDGYVSSDTIGGYLTRKTDRIADYIFPVGSNGLAARSGINRYRPVIITPLVNAAADEYAVRFANINATIDRTDGGNGFNLNRRDPTLTQINQLFYYMVDRIAGTSPADLKFYYLEDDGRYSTVAQVQNDSVWQDMFGEVVLNVIQPLHTEDMDRVAVLQNHDDFTQPVFTQAGADVDNDGIADRLDLDADNDGIANIDEVVSDPYGDHDNDQLFNYIDPDFPGCGVIINRICSNFDFDRDGMANHLDLDSDGDGIYDIFEAGGADQDFDAQVDYPIAGVANSMIDTDNDGFNDAQDHLDGGRADGLPEVTNGTPWPQGDRDNDGLVNFQDIDSDGDGIVDFIEGQTTAGFFFPDYIDGNRNGIDQAFDFPENGTYVVLPTDSDGDGQPDYLDLNSDNERTSDLAEGNDRTGDGLIDDADLPLGTDSDNDGLDDAFDTITLAATPSTNAENAQFAQLLPNLQNPGTVELDWRETGCKQQNCQPLATTRN